MADVLANARYRRSTAVPIFTCTPGKNGRRTPKPRAHGRCTTVSSIQSALRLSAECRESVPIALPFVMGARADDQSVYRRATVIRVRAASEADTTPIRATAGAQRRESATVETSDPEVGMRPVVPKEHKRERCVFALWPGNRTLNFRKIPFPGTFYPVINFDGSGHRGPSERRADV